MISIQTKTSNKKLIKLVSCLALLASTLILAVFKHLARQKIFASQFIQTYQREIDSGEQFLTDSGTSINQTLHCKSATIHEFPQDFLLFDDLKYFRIKTFYFLYFIYFVANLKVLIIKIIIQRSYYAFTHHHLSALRRFDCLR